MCSSLATRIGPAQFAGKSHLKANRDPHDYSITNSSTDNDELIKFGVGKSDSDFDFLSGNYWNRVALPLIAFSFPLA